MNLEGLTEKVTKGRWKTVYYEDRSGEIVAKKCRGDCGEVKALDEFSERNDKYTIGGRESKCKKCMAELTRKWRTNNNERNREYQRKWHEENRDYHIELNKEWRKNNPEYRRKYREENKERVKEVEQKYYKENKERIAENARNWYQNNKDHYIKAKQEYRKNNPDKVALIKQRRRARKISLPDDFTSEQMEVTLSWFGGCALTGDDGDYHWDHVIPIATGNGGTTFGNMAPLRSDLNISKNSANIFEWFEANRQRFKLEQWRFDRLIEWLASANAMSFEEYRAYVYECHANPNEINDAKAN
ncbi:hypothetical protein COJ96_05715 [Bacillus sp. AFS073361]|uniref:hypothetical protein n=1 Tax=Bacillus sp. AFS073361 TaxID=2033511 RepID=UPI000BF8F7F6|nr:hypothetical protein [Bacillus sp. AFS073361]PFP30210.1 hypothetical protein COJ96_05715 [Bacillus sp. AFS073361]